MRLTIYVRTGAFAILATLPACDRPPREAASAAVPARKAGLWEQVLTRDGKPGRLGGLRLCLDAAADQKLGVFGRHFAKGDCQRSISQDPGGAYHFSSTCHLDDGSVVSSRGVATGDFKTAYEVRSEVAVTGASLDPVNGAHMINISGRYKGPCPADMRPGDVSLGSGIKVNMDRLPQIAAAVSGG